MTKLTSILESKAIPVLALSVILMFAAVAMVSTPTALAETDDSSEEQSYEHGGDRECPNKDKKGSTKTNTSGNA